MGHDVEAEIERTAPNVFDSGVSQLWIDVDHSQPQNFGALADGLIGLWEERGAPAEQHPVVWGEAIVIKIVFGIVDLTIARAQFSRQRFGKNFGSNDERPDRNDFLPQRGSGRT